MKILIDNGHGENTPGKRSPDGKFREYKYTREIANSIVNELSKEGYDAELLVPENNDIPLRERCRRVNKICRKNGKNNVLLISVHVNAAGSGYKWYKASGWQAHTNRGNTKADILAEFLYDEAEKELVGKKIRTDMSDGDRDFENDFYILKHTACPAVLTENFFQDSKEDVEFLESEEGRTKIINLHINGIKRYISEYYEKQN